MTVVNHTREARRIADVTITMSIPFPSGTVAAPFKVVAD